MAEQTIPSPGSTSLTGAIAVLIFYGIHRLVMGEPLLDPNGYAITIFIAAFIAQYVPLRMIGDAMGDR